MEENYIKYYILNKPYGYLSQFTDKLNRKTLSEIIKSIPKDIYPVGRLDMDSEGLLLLTNDKSLVDFLLNPNNHHEREYLAQLEGIPNEYEIQKFRRGLLIENKITLPAKIELTNPSSIEPRIPPVRSRKNLETCWVKIIITEGRNRQVRKMTAAVGHPTLRLIRTRIKNISLGNLRPGDMRELTQTEIIELKKR